MQPLPVVRSQSFGHSPVPSNKYEIQFFAGNLDHLLGSDNFSSRSSINNVSSTWWVVLHMPNDMQISTGSAEDGRELFIGTLNRVVGEIEFRVEMFHVSIYFMAMR